MRIEWLDHIARGLSRRIAQYAEATRWGQLLEVFLTEIQEIEDAARALLVDRLLQNATGEMLDVYGALVGQKRVGLPDRLYRRLIRVRIQRNTSEGTPDDLIVVLKRLTEAKAIHLREYRPAEVQVGILADTELAGMLGDGSPLLIADDVPVSLSRVLAEMDAVGGIATVIRGGEVPFTLGSVHAADPSYGGGLASVTSHDNAGTFAEVA